MEVVGFFLSWLVLWWAGARRRPVDTGSLVWRRIWTGVLAFLAATLVAAGIGTRLYGFSVFMALAFGGLIYVGLRISDRLRRGVSMPRWNRAAPPAPVQPFEPVKVSAAPPPRAVAKRPRRPRHESLPGCLRFVYEDAEGNQTIRTVTRWREETEYVIGWCNSARAERTFRKDRVLEWIDSSDLLLDDPYG